MIETLLEESPINREHILGVGVAISGVVDSERGVMIKSVNLGWENVPVAQILNDALDLPVYVENDANASALGRVLVWAFPRYLTAPCTSKQKLVQELALFSVKRW